MTQRNGEEIWGSREEDFKKVEDIMDTEEECWTFDNCNCYEITYKNIKEKTNENHWTFMWDVCVLIQFPTINNYVTNLLADLSLDLCVRCLCLHDDNK